MLMLFQVSRKKMTITMLQLELRVTKSFTCVDGDSTLLGQVIGQKLSIILGIRTVRVNSYMINFSFSRWRKIII